MAELSPAAQAVLAAATQRLYGLDPEDVPLSASEHGCAIAAALCAAVDQPYDVPVWIQGDAYWAYRNGVDAERERYLAIAAELDGANSTFQEH